MVKEKAKVPKERTRAARTNQKEKVSLALSHSSTTMSTKERARASRNVVRAVEMR